MSDFLQRMKSAAKADKKTIVLPEGEDPRTIEAAKKIVEEDLANLIILGDPEQISVEGVTVIDPKNAEKHEAYAEKFAELRAKKGVTIEQAREQGIVVEKTLVVPVEVGIPYAMHDRVRDLSARSGAHVVACDYGADVTLSLVFRAGEQDAFVAAMRELMAGEDVCLVGDAEFDEF